MNSKEKGAINFLEKAKRNTKDAFLVLEPAAKDPAAQAILKAIDDLDMAIAAIRTRERV